MPRSIVEKIWDAHVVRQEQGHPAILAIDLVLLHEVTSAQAFDTLRERKLPVFDTSRVLATLDHSIPTRPNRFEIYDDQARNQVETMRRNARDFNVPIFDFDSGHQGVVHVVGPELGLTQPGLTVVCGDSHTATHGAFGALAFGIGTSEVSHVLATGCLLQEKPKTMQVEFIGTFPRGVYSKDAILKFIAQVGAGGGTGYVLTYTGACVTSMDMAARMTMCNMSIECGARAGLIEPDDVTFAYLKEKPAMRNADWSKAMALWSSFKSDSGAAFDHTEQVNVGSLAPMVTWGTNPGQAVQISERIPTLEELPDAELVSARHALEYIGLHPGAPIEGTPVDWAFIGSCTNGRIEDLRIAAAAMKGHKVHSNVTCYVVPGSEEVRAQAISEGLDQIFREAGADFRMPGCSMCLGMNDDKVPAGKRCISTSNRNFVGRQGSGSRTHLASPLTVAASAIEGRIVNGQNYLR